MSDSNTAPAMTTPACVRCGYNVSGIGNQGVCPECGTAIADAMKSPLLVNASEHYRRTILSGTRITLNVIYIKVGGVVAAILFASIVVDLIGKAGARPLEKNIPMFLFAVQAIVALGYWRMSAIDPREEPQSSGHGINLTIRLCAIASLVWAFLTVVLFQSVFGAGSEVSTANSDFIAFIGRFTQSARIVTNALMMSMMAFLLVRFGERVPDRNLVHSAGFCRWLLPILELSEFVNPLWGPALSLILFCSLLDRFRKHLKSIIETGQPAVHLRKYAR